MAMQLLRVSTDKRTDAAATRAAAPVAVWDLPLRLFHWGLVAGFAAAWATGGSGEPAHEIIGYAVAGLLGFRLLWGFAGTRHARFKDFVRPPRDVLRYLLDVALRRAPRHLGHNPAGGAMVLAFLSLLAAISLTGAMMQSDAFFGVQWVETAHDAAAKTLLALIPIHIAGALLMSWLHRENLIGAMVSGCKRAAPPQVKLIEGEHERRILERVRGAEGLVALVVALSFGAAYGWSTTTGRKTLIAGEIAPPKVLALKAPAPALPGLGVAQTGGEHVPFKERQDHVSGGPAKGSRSWLISSGGRLYDNWFKALGKAPPAAVHPAWPASNNNIEAAQTWRCKSCHGWDYRGRAGLYGRGPFATGIAGIRRMQSRPPAQIIAILGDQTHRFNDQQLPPQAKYRIALFVSQGQHTIRRYIDAKGHARGNPRKGRAVYQTVCAACHGFDGKTKQLGKSSDPTQKRAAILVGSKAASNPVEVLHKIRNGHPGAVMVSLRAFPIAYSADVLAYLQTLPRE